MKTALKPLVIGLTLASGSVAAFNFSFKDMRFADIIQQLPPQITAPITGEVDFQGSEATDADGDSLTYRYEIYDQNDSLVRTINGRTLRPNMASMGLEPNQDYVVKFFANDGVEDSEPAVKTFSTNMADQDWVDFFTANGGTHDADWKNASISGVSSLPNSPYPNGNPVNLDLSGNSLSNVDSLSSLNSAGELNLSNNNLTDLIGLANLKTVGGDLLLDGNDSLADLSPLIGLTSVTGKIELPQNIHLRSGFTSMGGSAACSNGNSGKFAPAQTQLDFNPSQELKDALANASQSPTLQANAAGAFSGAADGDKVAVAAGMGGVFSDESSLVSIGTYQDGNVPADWELYPDHFYFYCRDIENADIDRYNVYRVYYTPYFQESTVTWCNTNWRASDEFAGLSYGSDCTAFSVEEAAQLYNECPFDPSPSFSFSTPQIQEYSVSTDGSGDYYMDGSDRVPVYSATPEELNDAHIEFMGESYDFVSASWDSTSNRPSSYLALSVEGATNLANQYAGTSDPNILLNVPELPLPQLATQADACGCTDSNNDGACD